MADYYSPTAITHPVFLTEDLAGVLSARGGRVDPTGDKQTVLDGIVNESEPLAEYCVSFEEGTRDHDSFDEWLGDEGDEEEEYSDTFKELLIADMADVLHAVLKANPGVEEIEMQSSFTCSRMRLDGWGGSGLVVNKHGYLYLTTTSWEVEADGTIKPYGGFRRWDEQKEATDEQQAA